MAKKEEEVLKKLRKTLDTLHNDCLIMDNSLKIQIKLMVEDCIKAIETQQKEIKKGKKFKKDIVNLIMLWDEKELPDNETIISVLDTFMAEVSRLEDIEDRKIQVAVNFIEEKRDKYWKDKIQKEIKELEELRRYLTLKKHLMSINGMLDISVCIDVLKRLLEGG